MKRLLLLLALCLILAAPVMASPYTWQSVGDNNYFWYLPAPYGYPVFHNDITAGNQYVYNPYFGCVQNRNPSPYTYLSWSLPGPNGGFWGNTVFYQDNTNTTMKQSTAWPTTGGSDINRAEIVIIGGTAYQYYNGQLAGSAAGLTQNPSYFRICDTYGGGSDMNVDDLIAGDYLSTSRYVVGMPSPNGYFLKKDMVNPSASGIYNSTTGALVSSNTMYTTFGRSTISSNASENIYLINEDTGTIYDTQPTGNSTAGTTAWDISTKLFVASAPYGRYQVKFGDYYSTDIKYIADGAEINFDKASYNQQDTATITYNIDGPCWDTSTYTYAMKIYSANTWTVVSNQPISAMTGTFAYTFTTSDPQGEYYAVITATPNAGGNAIWMNYDYAALLAYATFTGYVNDGQTALPLSGANVSFSQGSIIQNSITIADGNYSADGFLTGATLTINVTKSGYSQYYVTFVPMVAKSIPLNLTLNSTTPIIAGEGIAGVARAGILTGTLITNGYGNPIAGDTITARNASDSLTCTNLTNNAGWYQFDESNGCMLVKTHLYNIFGIKSGYSNSQNYTVVAA